MKTETLSGIAFWVAVAILVSLVIIYSPVV